MGIQISNPTRRRLHISHGHAFILINLFKLSAPHCFLLNKTHSQFQCSASLRVLTLKPSNSLPFLNCSFLQSMANHKRFIEIAKNWQNFAALGRRRISYGKSSKVATKGHVVIQTVDKKKFMVPLSYLNSMIFRELFKMSEEEFGLPSDGPVVLPCNAFFMEYALSLLKKQVSKDVERALFTSITPSCCSSSYLVQQGNCQQQLILYGF